MTILYLQREGFLKSYESSRWWLVRNLYLFVLCGYLSIWLPSNLLLSWLVSNRMFTNGNRSADVIFKTMHFCSIGSSLCRGIKNRHLKCLINIRFSILQACRSRLKGMIVVVNSLFWRWDNSLAWVRLVMVLVCWPLGVLHFVQGITSLVPVILIITVKFAWDPVLSYSMCTPEH
jgi:hypothetical protein